MRNEFWYCNAQNHETDGTCQFCERDNCDGPHPDWDDDGLSDVEADAMTLRDAGMGTDEDYGHFGGEDDWLDGSYES